MSAGKFSGVAMHIIDRPSHSPHRAFLRTVNTVGGAGLDVYHLQERKSGAARGCQPRWSGAFDADQLAVMQEVVRRWNAHEQLRERLQECVSFLRANFDNDGETPYRFDLSDHPVIGPAVALLREVG